MSDDVRSDTHSKNLLQTETRLHSWKRDLFAVAGVVCTVAYAVLIPLSQPDAAL